MFDEIICSTRSDELELSINHFDEGSDDVASKLAALLTTQRGRKLLTRIVAFHCGGRTHAESLCLPLGFEAQRLLAQMPQMEVAQIALNYCDCIALQCPITCTCLGARACVGFSYGYGIVPSAPAAQVWTATSLQPWRGQSSPARTHLLISPWSTLTSRLLRVICGVFRRCEAWFI